MNEQPLSRQANLRADGSQIKLYPSEVKGRFVNYRFWVAWVLISFYLLLPWFKWNDLPLFQVDVFGRRLILLGNFFYPDDLPLFLPFILGTLFLVFAVTSILGRVWCGWACPQTVFLQYVFAPIETWIEGKAHLRRKRDDDGGPHKKRLKMLKHFLFVLFSFLIANTFLAYFVSIDTALSWFTQSPLKNWDAFLFVIGDTALFYFIFAHFKEQACTLACPYARLQGVLTDGKSLVVAYDHKRGETRGKPKRGQDNSHLGDCVDCNQCVKVCPTGIDIRFGNQLECIGCTRCIDACDSMMDVWKKPHGLISYTSEDTIEKGEPLKILKPRLVIYFILISGLYSVFSYLLLNRPLERIDITRKGSTPYIVQGDTVINYYHIRIRNKATTENSYKVLEIENSKHNLAEETISLVSGKLGSNALLIRTHKDQFHRGKLPIAIQVSNGTSTQSIETTLAGPYGN